MDLPDGFSGPPEQLAAIRQLHDLYADAVFRRDAAAWGALWTEDASWSLMGMQVAGRDAIVALWEKAMAGFAFVAFFVQPASTIIAGSEAEGRIFTHEVLETHEGTQSRPVGRYEDRYRLEAGQWRFSHRNFTLLKG